MRIISHILLLLLLSFNVNSESYDTNFFVDSANSHSEYTVEKNTDAREHHNAQLEENSVSTNCQMEYHDCGNHCFSALTYFDVSVGTPLRKNFFAHFIKNHISSNNQFIFKPPRFI